MRFPGANFIALNQRKATYDEMLNPGRLYNLFNELLVEKIISYYHIPLHKLRETNSIFNSSNQNINSE
jgi:hypothetical protein